ncbi:maleylpyruvate isomerase N-terminal domain-containing protein [Streptomyces sp. CoH27]|uniref:maleylpyruvate isomerase N-terminal domain-containing protein n=1 Tax=Streptomyces sp. CoH27 TaxID=2875763 RepID=UPI001CD6CCB1|nr:maleylpyruvate isomerase N-terminal domain-containing protein [Streptomyces sp. CoH27]
MSLQGMRGFRDAAQSIATLADDLSEKEWTAPSAAEGWTVQDVFTHAAELLGLLVAAVNGELPEPAEPIGVEKLNELAVQSRSDWTPARTLESFRTRFAQGEPVFAALQQEPAASTQAQLLDLGRYPLHAIADMFAFDLTTHLHWDILGPRGPLTHELPPPGEDQIAASLNWLTGGIPQMQSGLAAFLTAPLTLHFTGPGGRTVTLRPDAGRVVVEDGPSTAAVATVTSTGFDALAWTTHRVPWRELTRITGDFVAASRFLDQLNLI